MLKLFFFINTHTSVMHRKYFSRQYYATNQDTKPHLLQQNCLKKGLDLCRYVQSFSICHSFFYYAAFFPLKGKLKDIIIHFPYEISNDIIQCYQFIVGYESSTQDVNRGFPNLVPTETLMFCLYLSKFPNRLVTYPQKK